MRIETVCGIVGYTGSRPVVAILLDGLTRLEYRGYDSAGIAVQTSDGRILVWKSPGKVNELAASIDSSPPASLAGVGHTRWATHGVPNDINAHPQMDCKGVISVVHNGIVENHNQLREELRAAGHHFPSDTDTEVVAHLVENFMDRGEPLADAVRLAARRLQGANAFVVISSKKPGELAAVRLGNAGGVVVGYGKDEMFVASDLLALLPYTSRVTYLSPGEVAVVSRSSVGFFNLTGDTITKEVVRSFQDAESASKGPYPTFLLKEIFEQPEAVMNAFRGRLRLLPPEDVDLSEELGGKNALKEIKRVVLVGMGTSYHACIVGRYMIEGLAGLPAEAENSSEFRYRDVKLERDTLVVAITQSGETADTLGAMEQARRRGARLVTLCNVDGSQATRIADQVFALRGGPEVAVCSTKTFLCSLTVLYMLALHLAKVRGGVSPEGLSAAVREVASLPSLIGEVAEGCNEECASLAEALHHRRSFLFLGRGIHYPIAMEGALKLKEVSYIHAEGYMAGEMKHGPISLVEKGYPVVAIATASRLYEKMLGNISEVKARGAEVVALATRGDSQLSKLADRVLYLPKVSELVSPLLEVVPLQLFAYHVALKRDCDVDKPRNLAKSVTVE